MIHMDNAKPHRAKVVRKKILDLGFLEMPQPPYSPDISPSDFWLFGKLKRELRGINVKTIEELKKITLEKLKKINKKEFSSVYRNWIERLNYVINNKGDYVDK